MKVVTDCIPAPRSEVSKYAPKMETFNINPEKIREVIGSQGKVINDIIDKCDNVKIDISDEGKVVIYHTDKEAIKKARQMIENIVREAHVGEIFEGKVVKIESFGCFVNLFGNVDGMVHVSKLSHTRVAHPKDVVKIGQKLKVIVTEIDEKGRINLSHKEFEPKPVVEKKPEKEKVESSEETEK